MRILIRLITLVVVLLNEVLEASNTPYLIVRGGGNGKLFGAVSSIIGQLAIGRAEKNYIKTLEEQIETLERQVRKAQEETRQLRSLLKSNSLNNRKNHSSDVITRQNFLEKELKDEIERLKKHINELLTLKNEYMLLIEKETKRVEEQEHIIKKEREKYDVLQNTKDKLQKESKIEIEKLQKEAKIEIEKLQKEAKNEIEKRAMLLKQLQTEQDKSRRNMEELRSKLLLEFRKQMEETSSTYTKKIEQEHKKIKKDYEFKLQQEKQRSYDAIQNEKK